MTATDRSNPSPHAVVTGAGSGIGRAVARALVERGWQVTAIARCADRLQELAQECPGITPRPLDLTEFPYPEGLLPERIDALVHAAGMIPEPDLSSARPEDWSYAFALNVTAGAELARLAMPALRRSRGTIVMINSGAGVVEKPRNTIYGATKHALRILANGLRSDEEANGVRVSSVHPGPTDTPMLASEPDRSLLIKPETVAGVVISAITANEDTQLTDIEVRPRRELS
ncbi:NADP-dependent 3-hydroxy acid dehydrogenase YdfG [Naumannella halotolerans]|uniref:NADP-dependent 3-hydroxy acid dehydrogenase YdfG n=1 Tax=Naumannella halotolerans TaxID=993414 RepID=A0A4R7JAU9_9ACTN|nr:NADP-dependent 3-hydroxy acid dehydrogenase YdfG [Naumannella halotolerans]